MKITGGKRTQIMRVEQKAFSFTIDKWEPIFDTEVGGYRMNIWKGPIKGKPHKILENTKKL